MGLEVRVDREECIGAASCVRWAPHVFQIDDDGLAEVLDGGVAGTPREDIRERCAHRLILAEPILGSSYSSGRGGLDEH